MKARFNVVQHQNLIWTITHHHSLLFATVLMILRCCLFELWSRIPQLAVAATILYSMTLLAFKGINCLLRLQIASPLATHVLLQRPHINLCIFHSFAPLFLSTFHASCWFPAGTRRAAPSPPPKWAAARLTTPRWPFAQIALLAAIDSI